MANAKKDREAKKAVKDAFAEGLKKRFAKKEAKEPKSYFAEKLAEALKAKVAAEKAKKTATDNAIKKAVIAKWRAAKDKKSVDVKPNRPVLKRSSKDSKKKLALIEDAPKVTS